MVLVVLGFAVGLLYPVLIGALVGAVVFYNWQEGARVRQLIRDILVALRALALPLLAVALFGAFGEKPVSGPRGRRGPGAVAAPT